jgi:hypothetical protein
MREVHELQKQTDAAKKEMLSAYNEFKSSLKRKKREE